MSRAVPIQEFLSDPAGIKVPAGAQAFLAEGFLISDVNFITPKIILSWEVPKASVALLESFAIQSPNPMAYFECLFDLAVDDKELNSIRFTHLTDNTEKPPNFFMVFTERQKIQLRVYSRNTLFGDLAAHNGFGTLFIGRLGGKVWGLN